MYKFLEEVFYCLELGEPTQQHKLLCLALTLHFWECLAPFGNPLQTGASDHHLPKGAEPNSPLCHPILLFSHSCFTEEIPKDLKFIKVKLELIQRQTKAVTILHLPDHV